MFLLTFSYLLLCEFKYYENDGNQNNNLKSIESNNQNLAYTSWVEYLLIIWIVSFLFKLIFEVFMLKIVY
jgi:hypothetical protein